MAAPLYNIGDTVYLSESANAGFFEAVRVSSATISVNNQWVYTVVFGNKMPSPPSFGDRITYQQPQTLLFNESELISFCSAADIIEAVLEQRLAEVQALRESHC